MKRKKKLNKTLLSCLFIIFFPFKINLYAQNTLVIHATDSQGYWEKGIITNRKVVFTDKSFKASEIQTYVPAAGSYQIFAYVHHNWRKSFPCLYMEAIDAKGEVHRGYHKIENILYLDEGKKGRWFFVSLAQNPYWNLPAGKLSLKFWAEGEKSAWDNAEVPMEDKVSIENFFVIPVLNSGTKMFLPFVIDAESGRGNWDVSYYDSNNATNLIKTNKNNSTFSYEVNIPKSTYYQFWISALSSLGNDLEIYVDDKFGRKKINIKINSTNEWVLVPTKSLYLKQGPHTIIFKDLASNEIMIDFFILLPSLKNFN